MQTATAVRPQDTAASPTVPVVLVVDDEVAVTRLVGLIMRSEGYAVRIATSARAALELLEQQPVDVIVLDLQMPEMDGRAFYNRVREQGVTAPVLILSAYGARMASRELGAQAYLSKPFDPDVLADEVRALAASAP